MFDCTKVEKMVKRNVKNGIFYKWLLFALGIFYKWLLFVLLGFIQEVAVEEGALASLYFIFLYERTRLMLCFPGNSQPFEEIQQ